MKLLRYFLHILYPTRCPMCGDFIDFEETFCHDCESCLTEYTGNFLVDDSDGFCAAFEYNEKIAPAVYLLKNGICGNADFALGSALAEKIAKTDFFSDVDLIIPVPLSKDKENERGFNQSLLIAMVIGKKLNIPVIKDCITKVRETQEQKTLTKAERAVNLSGAYCVKRPEAVNRKCILIVDDVCTTGSTLAELTALLKEHGAARVYCAACCKTPLKPNRKM